MGRGVDQESFAEAVGADGRRYRRGRKRLAGDLEVDVVPKPAAPVELVSDVLSESFFAQQLRRYLSGELPQMEVKARFEDGQVSYGFWYQMNLHETSTLEQTWDIAKAILANDPFGGELKYRTLGGDIERAITVPGTIGQPPYPVTLVRDDGHGLVDILLGQEMVGGLRGSVAGEWIRQTDLGYSFTAQLEHEKQGGFGFLRVRLTPEKS